MEKIMTSQTRPSKSWKRYHFPPGFTQVIVDIGLLKWVTPFIPLTQGMSRSHFVAPNRLILFHWIEKKQKTFLLYKKGNSKWIYIEELSDFIL